MILYSLVSSTNETPFFFAIAFLLFAWLYSIVCQPLFLATDKKSPVGTNI
jgi:hypothetical protein